MFGIKSKPPAPAIVRLLRIMTVFAAGGWLFGALTVSDDGFLPALIGETAWHAGVIAAMVGLLCSGLIAWSGRWYVGALIAAVSSPPAIYLNFVLWPVQSWKMDASKATQIVLASYWEYLLPIVLLGGAFAAWWSHRPAMLAASPPEEAEAG